MISVTATAILYSVLVISDASAMDVESAPVQSVADTVALEHKKLRLNVYYVDASRGNDANSGTSQLRPWKTLARVNSHPFEPGDTVLLKKGEVWNEQLSITRSGNANAPITFGAYDPSNMRTFRSVTTKTANRLPDPIISGADPIDPSKWTKHSDNIYVAHLGSVNPSNQLYVSGKFYDVAHFPNKGFLHSTGDASNQRQVIVGDLNLPAKDINLTGSQLVAKSAAWTLDAVTISGYDRANGVINTYNDIRYVMGKGWGYYLRGQLWMLDSPNEWFYDHASGNIYLWLADGDHPSKHTILLSQRNSGITIQSANYVTISGITVAYSILENINVGTSTSNNTLERITSLGSYKGVQLNCNMCTLKQSNFQGALAYGAVSDGYRVTISDNTFNNVGNVGITPEVTPLTLIISGNKGVIRNNKLTNSGYIGIAFDGSNHLIQGNRVDNYCLKLGDCGGIYTWALDENNTDGGTIIDSNVISNAFVVLDGLPPLDNAPWMKEQGEGIYLDDRRHHITVTNNTVYNVSKGIFIHNGHNNVIRGNTVFNARQIAFAIQQDWVSAGYVRDNIVEDNFFHALEVPVAYYNYSEDRFDFGVYNNNRFCEAEPDNAVQLYTTASPKTTYHLEKWQKKSGQDTDSTVLSENCRKKVGSYVTSLKAL